MTPYNDGMLEVRWHGRGGQGAWTASELYAKTALSEGKYIQSFPEFGPERMGAPIQAYTRVSENPILLHCAVYNPHVVALLDPTLIKAFIKQGKNIYDGITPNGILLVNSTEKPECIPRLMRKIIQELETETGKRYTEIKNLGRNTNNFVIGTVEATKIAIEILGRPITNTAMLGAVIGASDKYRKIPKDELPCPEKPRVEILEISLDSLEKQIQERFWEGIAEKNVAVVQEAYKSVKLSEPMKVCAKV